MFLKNAQVNLQIIRYSLVHFKSLYILFYNIEECERCSNNCHMIHSLIPFTTKDSILLNDCYLFAHINIHSHSSSLPEYLNSFGIFLKVIEQDQELFQDFLHFYNSLSSSLYQISPANN